MEILHRRHAAHSHRGIWSDIRHYLGRLGCWSKAVKILILGAMKFPQRIENAQVDFIGPNGPADLPNKLQFTDLKDVVKRMLPADQASVVEQLSQALMEADAVAQVEERFRDEYAKIKPRPHAELLLLEHFHHNALEFATDDRYIGCSKPSCYCCHIYMQCHPGQFTPRPCHGNLWIQWAPPHPLPLADRGAAKNTARPQEHHTFKMLQKMLVYIRRDLQEQILSRRPRRAKQPDSTTGMSSVVLSLDRLLDSAAQDIGQSYDEDIPADCVDSDLVPIGSEEIDPKMSEPLIKTENEHMKHVTTQKTPATIEYEPNEKQEKMKIHEGPDDYPGTSSEGEDNDDAGILLFRGRGRLLR